MPGIAPTVRVPIGTRSDCPMWARSALDHAVGARRADRRVGARLSSAPRIAGGPGHSPTHERPDRTSMQRRPRDERPVLPRRVLSAVADHLADGRRTSPDGGHLRLRLRLRLRCVAEFSRIRSRRRRCAAPRPALLAPGSGLGRPRPARPRRPSLGGRADLTGSLVAHIAKPRGRLRGVPLA